MNLHEFQAKQLLAEYGVPVPPGKPARSVTEALAIARELGGESWIVKAQVHAGGRGKASGIKRANSLRELEDIVAQFLGSRLVTAQTTPEGLPINIVLVVRPCAIARELYLGLLVDRGRERVVVMASQAGGMDIEEIATGHPETIAWVAADPLHGLPADQCRDLAFALGLAEGQIDDFAEIMLGLYRLFIEKDASLIEINPLIVTEKGELVALDAKIAIDDNALYRQSALGATRDDTQEDARETAARHYGLNYITLDGTIACMVNGAGLAMATMDLIKLHGAEPANFLDVGGGTSAEKVAQAFKLILSDAKVKAILVNIFGGIVRCDLIAEGIIRATSEVDIHLPMVVRLEGTNAAQGRELLRTSGLSIIAASDLTDAANKAVAGSEG